MNKRFMLAMFALCFTGLSAQESDVEGQNVGQEVAAESDAVNASSDVAEGQKDVVDGNNDVAESDVQGGDAEGSN